MSLASAFACLPAHAAEDAAPQDTQPSATLPAVEVVGRRQSGSYHASEASGAKSSLPLRELPQAVRVMSRQTIDDLGATRLDETLDYVGGVSRQNHFGGLWDNVAIRGLAGDLNMGMPLLLNGFSGNRGYNAPRDTANVERIEFLKGPASSLYGTSEPGGTINIVTKKPLRKAAHAVEAYAGSFDLFRATVDSTGPLTQSLAYRLNLAVEDRNSFRDHIGTKRELIAPALTWRPSNDTKLDYNGEWLRHRMPLDRGVVAVAGRHDTVARERFLGEPADGDVEVENQTHQLTLQQILNDAWSSRVGLSYKQGSLEGYSTEAVDSLEPGDRTVRRQRRHRDYDSNDLSVQAEINGQAQLAGMENEILLGLELYRFELDQRMSRANPSNDAPYRIDIHAPVYGQPQPTPTLSTNTAEEQKNLALYVQDSIRLGERWRLLGGVRFDHYRQALDNLRTAKRTEQTHNAFSPRIGVSYLPDEEWTLFANLGRSFRPNSGTSASGAAFEPEAGLALELGSKWENAAKTLGAGIAWYEIRKKNVLTSDPGNINYSIAAGEVRSRGIDADVSGQLTRHWRINLSLAYIDAEITKDTTMAGRTLVNIPKVNGSLLLMYEDAIGENGRYGLGGGVTHVGERPGEQADPGFELPEYTTAKLAAYWKVNPKLRVSLDVDNLFDETYYTQSYQKTWVAPGAPRSLMLGVQAKF